MPVPDGACNVNPDRPLLHVNASVLFRAGCGRDPGRVPKIREGAIRYGPPVCRGGDTDRSGLDTSMYGIFPKR